MMESTADVGDGASMPAVVVGEEIDLDGPVYEVQLEEAYDDGVFYSVDDALETIGLGRFHLLLVVSVMPVWLADAMEMVLLSFLAPATSCHWDLTASEAALLTSVVFVGMLVGAVFWGVFNDHFGRKLGYGLSTVLVFSLGVAAAFSPNYGTLLAIRCGVGFGLGGSHVAVTILSEWLPAAHRASFVILMQVSWAFGTAAEGILAWIIMPNAPAWLGWRILAFCSALPLIVIIVMLPLVPASPRFLLSKGKEALATKALLRAASCNGATLPRGSLRLAPAPHATASSRRGGDGSSGGGGGSGGVAESDAAATAASASGADSLGDAPAPRSDRAARDAAARATRFERCGGASGKRACLAERNAALRSYCVRRSPGARVAAFLGARVQRLTEAVDRRCFLCNASQMAPRPIKLAAWLWSKLTCGVCAPGLSGTTALLSLVWVACAFTYYGLVLLSTALPVLRRSGNYCGFAAVYVDGGANVSAAAEEVLTHCEETTLTRDDYVATMVGSFSELPGVAVALVLVDLIGRKWSLTSTFLLSALAMLLLTACLPVELETAVLFAARAFVTAAFQVAFVVTPELYPTRSRSSAIGMLSAMSRLGGMLTPFVVEVLMQVSPTGGLMMYVASLTLAATAALILPKETAGLTLGAGKEGAPPRGGIELFGMGEGVEASLTAEDSLAAP